MSNHPTKQTTALTPGTVYRIRWPDHYNRHQREVGYLGEFMRWEQRHCQLHGEPLGREALFQRIKESGKRGGYCFSAKPGREVITNA